MRQPNVVQSHLRYPLNSFLGTPVAVRALRELFAFGDPLSPVTIAERAQVTPHGVRKALRTLVTAKIVEPVGQGRSVSYRIRESHPLASVLASLFEAESEAADAVFSRLRDAAKRLDPEPLALWIYGSVARGDDTPESEVEVILIAPGEDGEALAYTFHDEVKEIAREYGLTISIIGLSPAELIRYSGNEAWWEGVTDSALPLIGPDPTELPELIPSLVPEELLQPV